MLGFALPYSLIHLSIIGFTKVEPEPCRRTLPPSLAVLPVSPIFWPLQAASKNAELTEASKITHEPILVIAMFCLFIILCRKNVCSHAAVSCIGEHLMIDRKNDVSGRALRLGDECVNKLLNVLGDFFDGPEAYD